MTFEIRFLSQGASIRKVTTSLIVSVSFNEDISLKTSMFLVRILHILHIEHNPNCLAIP